MVQLNLEERSALEAQCQQRLATLAQQGVGIGGIGTRLLVELVSELLTPEQEAEGKERWLFWLSEQLDLAETEIRKRVLASGIVRGNGSAR